MSNQLHGAFARSGTARYYIASLILTVLFSLRVAAQLFQLFFDRSWLPSFTAWQSGTLPYGFLFILQVLILFLCVKTVLYFKQGVVTPDRRRGALFLAVGGAYFIGMLVRITLGLTIAKDHYWFNAPIPSFFHLILALLVLTYGHYHFTYSRRQHP